MCADIWDMGTLGHGDRFTVSVKFRLKHTCMSTS